MSFKYPKLNLILILSLAKSLRSKARNELPGRPMAPKKTPIKERRKGGGFFLVWGRFEAFNSPPPKKSGLEPKVRNAFYFSLHSFYSPHLLYLFFFLFLFRIK